MSRRLLAFLISLLTAAALLTVPSSPAAAASRTRCLPTSNQSAGTCFKVVRVRYPTKVIDSYALYNGRSRTGSYTCSFTKTVNRSYTFGGGLKGEIGGTVFKVIDASVSLEIYGSITSSSGDSTSLSSTFRLRPGEGATCQRTYGFVRSRIKRIEYRGTTNYVTYRNVNVPIEFGIRVID